MLTMAGETSAAAADVIDISDDDGKQQQQSDSVVAPTRKRRMNGVSPGSPRRLKQKVISYLLLDSDSEYSDVEICDPSPSKTQTTKSAASSEKSKNEGDKSPVSSSAAEASAVKLALSSSGTKTTSPALTSTASSSLVSSSSTSAPKTSSTSTKVAAAPPKQTTPSSKSSSASTVTQKTHQVLPTGETAYSSRGLRTSLKKTQRAIQAIRNTRDAVQKKTTEEDGGVISDSDNSDNDSSACKDGASSLDKTSSVALREMRANSDTLSAAGSKLETSCDKNGLTSKTSGAGTMFDMEVDSCQESDSDGQNVNDYNAVESEGEMEMHFDPVQNKWVSKEKSTVQSDTAGGKSTGELGGKDDGQTAGGSMDPHRQTGKSIHDCVQVISKSGDSGAVSVGGDQKASVEKARGDGDHVESTSQLAHNDQLQRQTEFDKSERNQQSNTLGTAAVEINRPNLAATQINTQVSAASEINSQVVGNAESSTSQQSSSDVRIMNVYSLTKSGQILRHSADAGTSSTTPGILVAHVISSVAGAATGRDSSCVSAVSSDKSATSCVSGATSRVADGTINTGTALDVADADSASNDASSLRIESVYTLHELDDDVAGKDNGQASSTASEAAEFPVGYTTLGNSLFREHLRQAQPTKSLLRFLQAAQDKHISVCRLCKEEIFHKPTLLLNDNQVNVMNVSGIFMITLPELCRLSFIDETIGGHYFLNKQNFPAVWLRKPSSLTGGKGQELSVCLVYLLLVMEFLFIKESVSDATRSRLESAHNARLTIVGDRHKQHGNEGLLSSNSLYTCSQVLMKLVQNRTKAPNLQRLEMPICISPPPDVSPGTDQQEAGTHKRRASSCTPPACECDEVKVELTQGEPSQSPTPVSTSAHIDQPQAHASSRMSPPTDRVAAPPQPDRSETRTSSCVSAPSDSVTPPPHGDESEKDSVGASLSVSENLFAIAWTMLLCHGKGSEGGFGRSLRLMYPPCGCQELPKADVVERSLWMTIDGHGKILNLGVLRFMNRNVFCFMRSGWLYISPSELQQRDLLPSNYSTILTPQFMANMCQVSDARTMDVKERNFLAQFFSVTSPLLVTPFLLHQLYGELKKEAPKYEQQYKAIYYMMILGHHCAWSLQVTPPTSQLHKVPGYEQAGGVEQPAAIIHGVVSPRTNCQEETIKKAYYDGGGGTPPAVKQVNDSLNGALLTTIAKFQLQSAAQPFCQCTLHSTQLDRFRFLSFRGVEMPHVTEMAFAGKTLHCFRRNTGFYVSMVELKLAQFPLFDLETLEEEEGVDNHPPISYVLSHEKAFVDCLPGAFAFHITDRLRNTLINLRLLHVMYNKAPQAHNLSHAKFRIKLWRHQCPVEQGGEAHVPLYSNDVSVSPPLPSDSQPMSASVAQSLLAAGVCASEPTSSHELAVRQQSAAVVSGPHVPQHTVHSTSQPPPLKSAVQQSVAVPIQSAVKQSVSGTCSSQPPTETSSGRTLELLNSSVSTPRSALQDQIVLMNQQVVGFPGYARTSQQTFPLQAANIQDMISNTVQRLTLNTAQPSQLQTASPIIAFRLSSTGQVSLCQPTLSQLLVSQHSIASLPAVGQPSNAFPTNSHPTATQSTVTQSAVSQSHVTQSTVSQLPVALGQSTASDTCVGQSAVGQATVGQSTSGQASTSSNMLAVAQERSGQAAATDLRRIIPSFSMILTTRLEVLSKSYSRDYVSFQLACNCGERRKGTFPSFSFLQCALDKKGQFTILEHVGQAIINGKILTCFHRDQHVFFSLDQIRQCRVVPDIRVLRDLFHRPNMLTKLTEDEYRVVEDCLMIGGDRDANDPLKRIAVNPVCLALAQQQSSSTLDSLPVALLQVGHLCPSQQTPVFNAQRTMPQHSYTQHAWMAAYQWQMDFVAQCASARQREGRSIDTDTAVLCVREIPVSTEGASCEESSTVLVTSLTPARWQTLVVKSDPDVGQSHDDLPASHFTATLTFKTGRPSAACLCEDEEGKVQVKPCDQTFLQQRVVSSTMLEGLVLDLKERTLKPSVSEAEMKDLMPEAMSKSHCVILVGTLTTADSTYCCFSIDSRLYLNWAEVVSKLPVLKDREICFKNAQRLHAFLYQAPDVVCTLLARRCGSHLSTLNAAPWVCANTLVAIYNLGSGMLEREKMLKRFVELSPSDVSFYGFLLIKKP